MAETVYDAHIFKHRQVGEREEVKIKLFSSDGTPIELGGSEGNNASVVARGLWTPTDTYDAGDIVERSRGLYLATTLSTNYDPAVAPPALTPEGRPIYGGLALGTPTDEFTLTQNLPNGLTYFHVRVFALVVTGVGAFIFTVEPGVAYVGYPNIYLSLDVTTDQNPSTSLRNKTGPIQYANVVSDPVTLAEGVYYVQVGKQNDTIIDTSAKLSVTTSNGGVISPWVPPPAPDAPWDLIANLGT